MIVTPSMVGGTPILSKSSDHFSFTGTIPSSKSILNRLLVLKSFSPELSIVGDSRCDDVMSMKQALKCLGVAKQNADTRVNEGLVDSAGHFNGGHCDYGPADQATSPRLADCGSAGTTFRFLALRSSRQKGRTFLQATPQLMKRPQQAITHVLTQLGCEAKLRSDGIEFDSDGWKDPKRPLFIDRSQSSQFASAVILSAWNLHFDLEIEMQGESDFLPSDSYFAMTADLVRAAGMELIQSEKQLFIPKGSQLRSSGFTAEPDMSSAFTIAGLGAVAGQVTLRSFPKTSLQPDWVFVEILNKMGVTISHDSESLCIEKPQKLLPIDWNLRDCPDLFPVLAVLCAHAEGASRLWGAPHLAHKESSRIASTAALLRGMHRRFEILEDGMVIEGRVATLDNRSTNELPVWNFDPAGDHRLAMAAAVARLAGASVRILDKNVVKKSFPEFWDIFASGGGTLL